MSPISAAQYYVFLASAAILFSILVPLAVMPWNGPLMRTSRELRWMLGLSAGYLLVNSLELVAWTEDATLFFAKLCYLFIPSLPTWWVLFSLEFFCDLRGFVRRGKKALWLIPVAALVIVFTNDIHRLHWKSWIFFTVGPFMGMRSGSYGPWFWALWVYLQSLVLIGFVIIFTSIARRSRELNRQNIFILVGISVPILCNVVYVLHLIPGLQKDFSPVAYGVSSLIMLMGAHRHYLFDLVPIARRALVEALADGLVAVNDAGRIVDTNPAARRICGLKEGMTGALAEETPFLATVLAILDQKGGITAEASPDGTRWFEVSTDIVLTGSHRLRLYSMRDVTERRRLLEEKTALADRLSAALANIRTLEGIVPICASCKRIRDDKGYWQAVESYVGSRTGAEFSHGLCPECSAKFFSKEDLESHEA